MPLNLLAIGFIALAAGVSGIQNNKNLKNNKKKVQATTVDDTLDDELN